MRRPSYLDTSAAVKLVRRERSSAGLVEHLLAAPLRMSSELLAVELRCAVRHLERPELLELVDEVLSALDLIPLGAAIHARAATAFDPPQRALDAIHLATALSVPTDDLDFVTYDDRQALAAEAAGLTVVTPV